MLQADAARINASIFGARRAGRRGARALDGQPARVQRVDDVDGAAVGHRPRVEKDARFSTQVNAVSCSAVAREIKLRVYERAPRDARLPPVRVPRRRRIPWVGSIGSRGAYARRQPLDRMAAQRSQRADDRPRDVFEERSSCDDSSITESDIASTWPTRPLFGPCELLASVQLPNRMARVRSRCRNGRCRCCRAHQGLEMKIVEMNPQRPGERGHRRPPAPLDAHADAHHRRGRRCRAAVASSRTSS